MPVLCYTHATRKQLCNKATPFSDTRVTSWLLTVGDCYLYLDVASSLPSEIRNSRDDVLVL